ncbi:hypothetical protein Glove_13g252 [Diversispora epigaea]|uniref:Uncharacterized protein n=1 Tax=Diversispora epigaea TaxID=1348612 RepID=A0A397JRR0_9GLOM|nr:hypothetical protein Glove_13g252 [Diversispora epigaea]
MNKIIITAILEQYFLVENEDKTQEGEIESSEILRATITQGGIRCYAAQLDEKSAQTVLNKI